MTTSIDSKLPGDVPPPPPWGVRPVGPSPALARRLERRPGAEGEVAVVLGAGGAFGPDVIRALQLRGMAAVVGADLQLTYPVPDAVYRRLDVSDGPALRDFLCHVERTAHQAGLRVGPVFDLSTVQTSPNAAVDRDRLQRGKEALAQALCALSGDVRLFYMSTAEVYGAPEGAPYGEDHVKAPFNDYGREKWHEERVLLAAHGRPTRGGRLHVVALRSWTICMVETDAEGRVVETRNYNDPIVAVAERLTRAGMKVPLVDPDLLAQFHLGEEVTEVALRLGDAPVDAGTWGRPFNCTGQPATHGEVRDALFDVFSEVAGPRPWWAHAARAALPRRLPRAGLVAFGRLLERLGTASGARDLSARLPFLYRSTHVDASALRRSMGGQLSDPAGGSTVEAVRRLALGLREGGPHAVNQRRYGMY